MQYTEKKLAMKRTTGVEVIKPEILQEHVLLLQCFTTSSMSRRRILLQLYVLVEQGLLLSLDKCSQIGANSA